jgi:hypothetical protein
VSLFFDVAYGLVIFLALLAVGTIPGAVLGLVARVRHRRLVLPPFALALAGWIWFGWIGGLYGISRTGLVLYSAVAAAGFVRGWLIGHQMGPHQFELPPKADERDSAGS